MDYCLGHPGPDGRYHYHFYAYAYSDYKGCAMSCDTSGPSDIVGVAGDGFPVYGPMQWWNPIEKKAYIEQCPDCILTQIDSTMTDKCGGVEMGDGDPEIGNVYRYIGKGEFPYIYQCYRGEGKARNSCGIDSRGSNGHSCDLFNRDYTSSLKEMGLHSYKPL